jgi:hypothetical protein
VPIGVARRTSTQSRTQRSRAVKWRGSAILSESVNVRTVVIVPWREVFAYCLFVSLYTTFASARDGLTARSTCMDTIGRDKARNAGPYARNADKDVMTEFTAFLSAFVAS